MKTKLILTLIVLVTLNACTLAGERTNGSDLEDQPLLNEMTFVGAYFAPYKNSLDEIVPFDINNNDLTFFISEQKSENGETYFHSQTSGNFMSSHVDVNVLDDTDITTLTSKIPVIKNVDFIHAVFAIYKDEDGNYTTEHSGNFKGMSGHSMSREVKTITNDGEFTRTINIEVEFVEYDPLKEVRVLTIDENYNILDEQKVDEKSEFTLENALQSIVVEEIRVDREGIEYKDVTFYSYRNLSKSPETHHLIVSDTDNDDPYGNVYGITIRVSP